MLQTWFKNQQIEHKKKLRLHVPEFLISLLLSSYKQKYPCQNVKATTMYCPMVKLSVFQAVPRVCTGSNPESAMLTVFSTG